MTSLRALTVALAVAILSPVVAQAQPSEAQKREAKELNEKATRLYEVGKYGEAIEEYQKVYLLVDDPVLLYNIAQSYRLWNKPEDSIRFYRNYLRRAPSAPNRADVEKKIADQEKIIEERKRAPVTAPPVTTPPVDTTTTAPPPPLPPVTTTPATTTSPPPIDPTTPPMVVQTDGPTRGRGRRIAAYVLLITGGALVATSVVAGAVASGKAKDLERMSKDPTRPTFDPTIEKAGKAANGVAIGAGVAGAAAGIVGGILLLTSSSSSEPSVALFPLVGPQLAGAGGRVTF
jgi:tetratricopeptide (TPR) repeat protein